MNKRQANIAVKTINTWPNFEAFSIPAGPRNKKFFTVKWREKDIKQGFIAFQREFEELKHKQEQIKEK